MSPRLHEELKQTKPFKSLEEEAVLNVARTAAVLEHAMTQALKPHDITPTQYNVLRILRGAGADGLCRNEVGERLIRRVPDVTRLLDRMEHAGLIGRLRGGADRRFVTTRITAKGLDLVNDLDARVLAVHKGLLGHLGADKLQRLIQLLEAVRDGI
jgi:DNA-binding MarR family transcriptional regulator